MSDSFFTLLHIIIASKPLTFCSVVYMLLYSAAIIANLKLTLTYSHSPGDCLAKINFIRED